jgi:hypothetical protein
MNGICSHHDTQRKKDTIRDDPSETNNSSRICTVLPINAAEVVPPQHFPVYLTPLANAATSNTEPGVFP